jgi:hypothetical protein
MANAPESGKRHRGQGQDQLNRPLALASICATLGTVTVVRSCTNWKSRSLKRKNSAKRDLWIVCFPAALSDLWCSSS